MEWIETERIEMEWKKVEKLLLFLCEQAMRLVIELS